MHKMDVAEGPSHCTATRLNNEGNLHPFPPGEVCMWFEHLGTGSRH